MIPKTLEWLMSEERGGRRRRSSGEIGIIGAGLSGLADSLLTCADSLRRLELVVDSEADAGVRGTMRTDPVDGMRFEAGATASDQQSPIVSAFVRDLGSRRPAAATDSERHADAYVYHDRLHRLPSRSARFFDWFSC